MAAELAERLEETDLMCRERRISECLKTLRNIQQELDPKTPHALAWRLARALHDAAEQTKGEEQKSLFEESVQWAEKAIELDGDSALSYKWLAITLAQSGKIKGQAERIKDAFRIKELGEKSLLLNPQDAAVQHLWCFNVANISFLERTAASAIFATPPQSSYQEALPFLLKHEELLEKGSGGITRNKIMLGDTYKNLNQPEEAKKYYQFAIDRPVMCHADQLYKDEAEKKLAALSSSSSSWW